MREVITLGPRDIEVDHTHIDPIIHFYPGKEQPETLIHDLVQGLFLLHDTTSMIENINSQIKRETDPSNLKILNTIKQQYQKNLDAANDYATKFYKRMEFK